MTLTPTVSVHFFSFEVFPMKQCFTHLIAGMDGPMLARLILTPSKLASLAGGLRQIAATSHSVLGQVKKHTMISEVL